MSEFFRLGGWGMYPTLAFGLLFVLATLRYGAYPLPSMHGLLYSLGGMSLVSGVLGFSTGLMKSLLCSPIGDPAKRWIWLVGMGESMANIVLALVMLMLGLVIVGIGTFRRASNNQ